jgi:hypothetical protein
MTVRKQLPSRQQGAAGKRQAHSRKAAVPEKAGMQQADRQAAGGKQKAAATIGRKQAQGSQ